MAKKRLVIELREDANTPSQVAHLKVGDRVRPRAVRARAGSPVLSEAQLIGLLQRHGIGRPATYELVAESLIKHGYATRESGGLRVTPLGQAVAHFLADQGQAVFDLGFTAAFETQLESIANGSATYPQVLRQLHSRIQSIG
jgi:DNA topoisomerase IA